jgi:hypothetical protein
MSVDPNTAYPTPPIHLSMTTYWSSADDVRNVGHDFGHRRWTLRRRGRNTRDIRDEPGGLSST